MAEDAVACPILATYPLTGVGDEPWPGYRIFTYGAKQGGPFASPFGVVHAVERLPGEPERCRGSSGRSC